MRLDHVSYATHATHLADEVQRIGSRLQRPFVDGGIHPRFGTRNFVLPLGGRNYVEVVAALDHPAAEQAPFGQAVHERAEQGGGWLGWVVAVDDLAPFETRVGRASVEGHRVRPDGHDLCWRQLGVNDLRAEPYLPFFIHWEGDPDDHPGAGGADVPRLHSLCLAGDVERTAAWLGADPAHLLDGIGLEWATDTQPGLVSVTFDTACGLVTID
ncbi:MAG TPA: VOC family protein [Actinomycetes bacterium]|nr:VOC family protein [Actinomycetes bacterium]